MATVTTESSKVIAEGGRGVAFVRADLREKFPSYDRVYDCMGGSDLIKAKSTHYLPAPDASNTSPENIARYEAYIQRAVFYNVTQRTALGLQGQVFSRPPIMTYPAALEMVITDSNGSGISAEQIAKDAFWFTLGGGRSGLFVDYPPVDKVTTVAELNKGNIRPTISVFGPKDIINWRTKRVGSNDILSLVVLRELYTVEDDGFETIEAVQYRELRLDDNNRYYVQLWRAPDPKGDNFEKYGSPYFPTNGRGQPLDAIAFTFIGSKNNEPSIDPMPLLDIANINVAHYCNSADYEEMVYIVGQPMLVVSGLTKEWYEKQLGKKIPFGSRSGLGLPENCKAELLQVNENTVAMEAMTHKERQMISLGAKLVEQKTVQRTAKEASMENAAEESTLVSIANNVSSAMTWALEWCAVFRNVPETGIEFKLNTDFEMARMSGEEIAKVIESWTKEAISWTEMRTVLHKAGLASQDDKEAKAEIEEASAAAIATAALAMADMQTPPNNVGNEDE